MELRWIGGPAALAEEAAAIVSALLTQKPRATIALPTGATPRGLYERLTRLRQAGSLSLAQARFFNLDEFAGLPPEDPRSYAAYLRLHVLEPNGIDPGQVRLLRGDAPDLAAECRAHDRAIEAAGGLDLAILGLGANGHVAFNEPGDAWDQGTHVVTLAPSTRRAQRRRFATAGDVPRRGLTLGLANLRAARALLLLAMGEGKAAAMAAILAGRADPAWPVTALLGHPAFTILADRRLKPVGRQAKSG